MAWPVTDDIRIPDHWPVAQDVARYVGDAVAVVVATSRNSALDAAELVEVDYEVMEAVVDVEAALADDAPRVHESFDDNKSYTWTLTNGDVDAAFARADVVVKERYTQPRLIPNAMEPGRSSSSRCPRRATSRCGRPRRSPTSRRYCSHSLSGSPSRRSA